MVALGIGLGLVFGRRSGGVVPFKLPLGTAMALMGTSTPQYHNDASSTSITKRGFGEVNWLQLVFPSFRFRNVKDTGNSRGFSGDNFGIANQTAAQVRARLSSCIGYDAVMLYMGSNDLETMAAADIFAIVVDSIAYLRSIGVKKIFLRLVHPRGTTGASGIADTSAPYWQRRIDLNNMQRTLAAPDVIIIDPTPNLVLVGSAIEEADPLVLRDGLHLNMRGGWLASLPWIAVIGDHFETGVYWMPNASSPSNLIPNGDMSVATGGVVGTGATGTLPAQFRAGRATGTGNTAYSIVDGRLRGTMPTTACSVNVYATDTPATSNSGVAVTGLDGQTVQCCMKMRIKSGFEFITTFNSSVETRASSTGASTQTTSTMTQTGTSSVIFKADAGEQVYEVLMDPLTVPAGTTHLFFNHLIGKADGGAVVYEIDDFEVRIAA